MQSALRLRRSRRSIQVLTAAALAATATVARADTLAWTNSGLNFVWPDSANWYNAIPIDDDTVPGISDIVSFTDAGTGTISISSAQNISDLQFSNTLSSYTFTDVSSPSGTTLSLQYLDFAQSTVTNTFTSTVGISDSGGQGIQIFPGAGTVDLQGVVNSPQGMVLNNSDGQLVLENPGNIIGPVTITGGLLAASSPAALSGVSEIEMSGDGLPPTVSVTPVDGVSASSLPELIVDGNSTGQIKLTSNSSNIEPLGTQGLTPTTITYHNLVLSDGSVAIISTDFTPYTVGMSALNLFGSGAISTDAGSFFSAKSQESIGTITQFAANATLAFDGGGSTIIQTDSTRNASTTIYGGIISLQTFMGLGTGTINVSAGLADTIGQMDPGGALNFLAASGTSFPTMVNVGAFAAIGGNLTDAVYSGAHQNVNLSADAILFPSAGSALPGQVGGHAAYWLGITNNSNSYTVGDGAGSLYKGAALGTFTPDGALPVGGFVGTITDPFSEDLLVHASGFTAIGQPNVSNGQPISALASPTLNSANGVADIAYDGAGGQLAFFAPIAGTATTINLSNGNPTDSLITLNTSGDVGSAQTFNLNSGTLLSLYQPNDVQGTLNIGSGGMFLHDAALGATTGNFHIENGGTLQVTSQISAPGHGASTYTWDDGSIVEFFNSTVSTAQAGAADNTWVSPNSDIDIDFSNTLTNTLSGVELEMLSTRRITTDHGGMLSGGSGIVPAPSAGPTDTFLFTAAQNTILEIDDSIAMTPGQTLQIGDVNQWGPNHLLQDGSVNLSGPVNAQKVNIAAGTFNLFSSLPSTSVITNSGVFGVEGTTTVASITGVGTTSIGPGGDLTVPVINQLTGVDNENLLTVTSSGTIGALTGGGVVTINDGARLVIAPNSGTSLQEGVVLNGTGTLDITNNALIVPYDSDSPVAQIASQIKSGFNGGDWKGPGITSSTAATDAASNSAPFFGNAAIGYADNTLLGRSDIPAASVLVRFTFFGDTDLNGVVNGDDFTNFLAGFSDPTDNPPNWVDGDFDYNGVVNGDDFSLFLAAFQANLGSLSELEHQIEMSSLLTPGQQQSFLSEIAAVPEPATLGLLALSAAMIMPRRRRERSSPINP